MMQMTRDLAEHQLNVLLRLKSARQVKFLQLTDPRVNRILNLTITYKSLENEYQLDAVLEYDNVIFFKLEKAVFIPIGE